MYNRQQTHVRGYAVQIAGGIMDVHKAANIADTDLPRINEKGSTDAPDSLTRRDIEQMARAMEARAGAAFMKQIQQTVSETQERLSEETSSVHRQTQKNSRPAENSGKDSVELSREIRRRTQEGEWTQKLEVLLKTLENWTPASESSYPMEEALRNLADLFQKLWGEIAQTAPEIQLMWMDRLDQAAQKALKNFLEAYLRQELDFFAKYAGAKVSQDIRSSLYYQVTGRYLSEQEAHGFWNGSGRGRQDFYGQGQNTGLPHDSAWNKEMVSGREQSAAGRYTASNAHGSHYVSGNSASGYHLEHLRRQEREASLLPGRRLNQAEGASLFTKTAQGRFDSEDMAKVEPFCRFMNQDTLMEEWGALKIPQEAAGCAAALLYFMGSSFVSVSGISQPMQETVSSAVDRMIDVYINRFLEELKRGARGRTNQGQGWDSCGPAAQGPAIGKELDPGQIRKTIFQVYYHILRRFQEGKSFQESLENGIAYAGKSYARRLQESGRTDDQYVHYFEWTDQDQEDKNKNCRHGLRRDWQRYQQAVGLDGQGGWGMDYMNQGYWAMGLAPASGWGTAMRRALPAFVLTALALLICIYFGLF